YAALASAPIPLSTHHGSAMPSSAAAVVWLTTASGATCCWSTSHIVFTDAGAAVGVEYPRNSVVSSGPSRRRVETPRSRHCAREKRERGGSGVARMRSKVRTLTRDGSSRLGGVDRARLWRSRPHRRTAATPELR